MYVITLIEINLQAAFEVYIRRAYRAYTLLSIDYEEGDGVDDGELPSVVTWRFNLGQSHSPPSTPRITFGSVDSFLPFNIFLMLRSSQRKS
jgi:hypothetical protein